MNCPHFVRFTVVLPAVAILLAGCAGSSNSVANSNASTNTSATPTAQAPSGPSAPAKQPQRFGAYGVSTTGYSSNLSTMINSMVTGEDDEPETKVAAAPPAGPAAAPGAVPASGAKTAAGAPPTGAAQPGQAPAQPQVAQNQPPQEPPKSKAQVAEENVPGLYGTPRSPQKDVVHWLMESTKDE